MSVTVSFLIGYLLGEISPASIIASIKKTNLREQGTKNLGATNTTLALGFKYGLTVLFFDMLKGYSSVKIAKVLFPSLSVAGLLGGCGAVYGHIYPAYMKFKGGKGLAAFGGVLLAYSPLIFIELLFMGIFLVWVTDFPIMLTFSATFLAPFLVALRTRDFYAFLVMLFISGIIIFKHRANLVNLLKGKESRWSEYIAQRAEKKKISND